MSITLKLNAIEPYCINFYNYAHLIKAVCSVQISYIFICYVVVLRISSQFLIKAGYCI